MDPEVGQTYANLLRRRQPRRGDKWHLDEVVLTIKGEHHYLWRAVDQEGHTLDVLVQRRRDRQAAKAQIMPDVEHRQHNGLNNWAVVSHQPTRQRERQMRRFKSPGQAQRFLSAHGPINNAFRCQRHRLPAEQYRCVRNSAFSLWNEVTGVENTQ